MVRMDRAGVDLLAADVGKDHVPVARALLDQPFLLGKWRSNALGVGVVEGESHAEYEAADEAPAGIGLEPFRVVVATVVEEKRGDSVDVPPV